jgi:hypothetical protein
MSVPTALRHGTFSIKPLKSGIKKGFIRTECSKNETKLKEGKFEVIDSMRHGWVSFKLVV